MRALRLHRRIVPAQADAGCENVGQSPSPRPASAQKEITMRTIFIASVLTLTVSNPTPCTESARRSPSIQREMYAALEILQGDRPEAAVPIGAELVRKHPEDWRAWYIRFLTMEVLPLTLLERSSLEEVPEAGGRESIRALRAYLAAPPEMRLVLTRDFVARNPGDALGHALLASSRLAAGD